MGTGLEQAVLKALIAHGRMGLARVLCGRSTARGRRRGVVADGQPRLRPGAFHQIVGSPRAPILVATQPGSTAVATIAGRRRATAAARVASNSLLSE